MHSRNTLIKLSVVALALTAAPKLLTETFAIPSVLAQSPTPTSFPLPESLPDGSTVKVDGSTSMTVVNEALKNRFEQKYSGSGVELAANGTDEALQSLLNGDITVAAVGRPLTDAEKAQGLIEVPIKREKIAIIVGPENPYQGDVTFEQFAKIFRGEITDWSQIGGQPGPIRFVDRPDFSDTRRSLSNYAVFEAAPFETGPNTTQIATDETADLIKELGRDGISYAIADQVLGQSNVKIIPMHQTLPDDPRYPFSQPRGYVYKETPDVVGQAFLGFATSEPGQEVVAAGAVAGAVAGAAAGTASPSASPSPEAAAAVSPSPEAAVAGSSSPEAVAQAPAAEVAPERGGFPWWILAIPILGGLLWWLLRDRGGPVPAAVPGPAAAPAPVAAVPPPVRVPDGRIILTPRDCRHAYAYWEVPEERKAQFREQGGRKLALRLYDVTDIDMDRQVPHSVKQFDCRESDPDLHVPIAIDNRDYVAELGYVTEDGRWMKVARSEHVRVPACPAPEAKPVTAVAPPIAEPKPVEPPKVAEPVAKVGGAALATGAALAGGAAIAGAAIANAAKPKAPEPPAPSVPVAPVAPVVVAPKARMILTPRDNQRVYAYWEASDAEKAALKQQGGQQFSLRLYDVTGVDPEQQLPPAIQQFNCDDLDQDRHLLLPATNRDYLAEVGYTTPDGRWLTLARSNSIRIAPPSSDAVTAVGTALAGGATAVAAAGAVRSISSEPRPLETERQQAPVPHVTPVAQPGDLSETGRCSIKNITVHSRHNCYLLNDEQMRQLQDQTAVTKVLLPGTHLVRIKSGAFGYGSRSKQGEPIVLLWLHGGAVVNKKTEIPVAATWSTLNGYDDTLTLEVLETTTLHAFFFDTHLDDNDGEVTLSVVSLPAL